ncbi:MAG: DUF86 domain-containing protein [Deltaproteobacteria bacterium]|nr:DUF86 domain-containing protein [Deltaproteobacteria bacterium]
MFDRELVLEILRQIEEAATTILNRFEPVATVADFTNSPAGVEKMDSICMLLIVVGEALKNLDRKTDGTLLENYPDIDWKKAKGMRDILTHHYSEVNAEAVFNTCNDKIGPLALTIRKIISDLSRDTL